jgi:ankyrin repeat protein
MQDVDFLEAVHQGNEHILTGLLSKSKIWLSVKDSSGRSALHIAVIAGHPVVVELLLGHGAEVNALDKADNTALHIAVIAEYPMVVELLLSHGANVNALDKSGNSALHYAFRKDHDDIVKLLLQPGVELNVLDSSGKSALHYASQAGHEGAVKLLIQGGADINSSNHGYQRTPLAFAIGRSWYFAIYSAENFRDQMTKLLLDAGARFSSKDWAFLPPDRQEQFADYRPIAC